MSFFSKNEDFDIYENFPDYEKTSPYNIKTRTITDSEYLSIPFYYKSKLKTLLTVPGMVLILLSIIGVILFLGIIIGRLAFGRYISYLLYDQPFFNCSDIECI